MSGIDGIRGGMALQCRASASNKRRRRLLGWLAAPASAVAQRLTCSAGLARRESVVSSVGEKRRRRLSACAHRQKSTSEMCAFGAPEAAYVPLSSAARRREVNSGEENHEGNIWRGGIFNRHVHLLK